MTTRPGALFALLIATIAAVIFWAFFPNWIGASVVIGMLLALGLTLCEKGEL